MSRGFFLWMLVVVGYVGFEVNAVRRSQHLFEPLHTFDEFVSMHHAMETCGSPGAEQRRSFGLNLEAVRRRAREDLAEANPRESPDAIARMATERARAREREVDAMVEAAGCDGPEVRKLRKLYELRARLRVR